MSMRRPRICHLSSVHPPYDTRIFSKECRTLANAGYEVILVIPHSGDCTEQNVLLKAVPVPHRRLTRMTYTAWQIFSIARRLQADIYHYHDPELLPLGLVLKWLGYKVIYDAHEDTPRDIGDRSYLSPWMRKVVPTIIEHLEDAVARRMSAIIAATPAIGDRFKALNHNTLTLNNYPWTSELALTGSAPPQKKHQVCYVGCISELRGLFQMMEAADQVGVTLVLGGDFESQHLRETARNHPAWKSVVDLGYIDRNRFAQLLSESLAGLLLFHPHPNHIDSRPNKLFEYMSGGIPIVASNFPMWQKIINDEQCGICVDPQSISEIADALRWIIEHPPQAQEMGNHGRRAVVDRYNWEQESIKLLALYADLVPIAKNSPGNEFTFQQKAIP